MAKEVNTVSLSDNLGKDPEFKNVGSGLATFSIAVNRFIPRSDGQFDKQTGWFKCVAWGPVAEAITEKLTKGSRVMVQGRLQAHNWVTNQGEVKTDVEIVINSFSLLRERKAAAEEEEYEEPLAGGQEEAMLKKHPVRGKLPPAPRYGIIRGGVETKPTQKRGRKTS